MAIPRLMAWLKAAFGPGRDAIAFKDLQLKRHREARAVNQYE